MILVRYRIIRIPLFCITAFFSGVSAGQNNPGYMGYRKSIDLSITPQFLNVYSDGFRVKPQFDLGFEAAFNQRLSMRIDLRRSSNYLNQNDLNRFDYQVIDNDASSAMLTTAGNPVGRFDYQHTSVTAGARLFKPENGAIAPYGPYFGVDLTYCSAVVTNTSDLRFMFINRPTYTMVQYNNEPWNNIKIVALNLNMGKRIYLNNKGVSLFYQAGMGYPIWQSSSYVIGNSYLQTNNHQDLTENLMVSHIANSSLFNFKLGIGYGLK